MENELKFNSHVCTTIKQSRKLLDLGLKPETADCMWCAVTKDAKGKEIPTKNIIWYLQAHTSTSKQIVGFMEYTHIPAWSLHRLMEIAEMDCFNSVATAYDEVISVIKFQHGEGYINKEYLKQ